VFSINFGKKIGADPSCRLRKKRKNEHFNSENDVTEPKARKLLNYPVKKLLTAGQRTVTGFRKPGDVIFRNYKVQVFFVFLENDKTDRANFFSGFIRNTCALQSVLKSTAPGL